MKPYLNKEQSRSNPDLPTCPSEEDPRLRKMKKGYISKQKTRNRRDERRNS